MIYFIWFLAAVLLANVYVIVGIIIGVDELARNKRATGRYLRYVIVAWPYCLYVYWWSK